MLFVFDAITNQYKTQEMCSRVVSEDPFLIVYCPDKCKTQRLCFEAVDGSLAALKLVSHWFVKSKMIKNTLLLCTKIKIHSTWIKILVMLHCGYS